MKITAYEVRSDERRTLEHCAEGHGVTLTTLADALTPETLHHAEGADGVSILGKSKLDAQLLHELGAMGVRAVSTRTVGYDHIDLAAAMREGLQVFNASYAPDGVAEFTVMLMLMALRHYKQALYRANANDYSLTGMLGKELHNLTVGVIGTGRIGQRVIRILQGFGCHILAYNDFKNLPQDTSARYCGLDELYRDSDIITLHLPLTDHTYHMVDRNALGKMKDGVVLINCARGSLMAIEDLIWGIETKKIGALGMDVIEDEDEIYHQDRRSDILINRNMAYIRQFPNVILTQHMAFYTDAAVESMAVCGIQRIVEFIREGTTDNTLR